MRVRLSRTWGPLSGANKRCETEVELDPQTMRAEDTNADALADLSHAVAQLKRSFSRELCAQAVEPGWNRIRCRAMGESELGADHEHENNGV